LGQFKQRNHIIITLQVNNPNIYITHVYYYILGCVNFEIVSKPMSGLSHQIIILPGAATNSKLPPKPTIFHDQYNEYTVITFM
jgi:hypothetical protein